jgi:Ca-activated chloride channel family protein
MTVWRAIVGVIVLAGAMGQQPAPVLKLIEPTADTILAGSITFRVSLTGGRLRQVEFQVDGVEACRATAAPFEGTWNAGSVVSARVVRAVATLDDGRRLPVAIRTKGVTVSETSHVDSVTVTALVTDSRGRFVSGLTADDFRILDEGVPQKVVMLDAGQDGAEVVVALDLSGSMFPVLGDLQDVARDFLGRLRPVDKVTLAGFNAGFFVIAPRDATRAALDQAIGKLDPYGGTAIFDALIAGVKILSAQTGRRAIIMFSDGDDISSRASLESARAELHGQDVVLYLVATGKADSDPVLRRSLENLCEETGGSAFFAGKLSGTVDHFREIVDDMAKQYLLAFSPEPVFSDGKFRKISVEPKDKSLRIRARTGYFAAKR